MIEGLVGSVLKLPLKAANLIYTKAYYGKGLRCPNVVVDHIEDENILIIAPELDSAIIGMGGTLLKYREMEASKSLISFENKADEVDKIAEIYGIDKVYCLEYVRNREEDLLVGELLEILRERKPGRIYTPFLFNNNKEHIKITRALLKSLEIYNEDFKSIWMYEAGTPNDLRLINRVVTLDREVSREKEEVYKVFEASKKGFDAFSILDRNKGLLLEDKAYGAETFIKLRLENAKEVDRMLINKGFESKDIKGITNQFNLISGFLSNKEKRNRYNNNLNYVLKGKFISSKGEE